MSEVWPGPGAERITDLQSEGTRIRALSPLSRYGQVPSYSPIRLIRVQHCRKGLYVYKVVEGPSIRPIVMNTGSHFLQDSDIKSRHIDSYK